MTKTAQNYNLFLYEKLLSLGILLCVTLIICFIFYSDYILKIPACPLCLKERIIYYISAPLLLALILAPKKIISLKIRRVLCFLMFIGFLINSLLSFYHLGVEQKFWPAPASCAIHKPENMSPDEIWKSLSQKNVPSCDVPAIHIFGISLAGWNIFISLMLASFFAYILRQQKKYLHSA